MDFIHGGITVQDQPRNLWMCPSHRLDLRHEYSDQLEADAAAGVHRHSDAQDITGETRVDQIVRHHAAVRWIPNVILSATQDKPLELRTPIHARTRFWIMPLEVCRFLVRVRCRRSRILPERLERLRITVRVCHRARIRRHEIRRQQAVNFFNTQML